jgi:uncharacterized membrane protein
MNQAQRMLAVAVVSIAVAVAVVLAAYGPSLSLTKERPSATALSVDGEAGLGVVPLSEIGESARWFSYNSSGGAEVRIFVVKDSGGGTRAAFDACDVCYGAGKGYAQRGDEMVCRNCAMRFPISGLGELNSGSGCWPSNLNYALRADMIEIQLADLDAKAWMFE